MGVARALNHVFPSVSFERSNPEILVLWYLGPWRRWLLKQSFRFLKLHTSNLRSLWKLLDSYCSSQCTNGMCFQHEAAPAALHVVLHDFGFWMVSNYSPSPVLCSSTLATEKYHEEKLCPSPQENSACLHLECSQRSGIQEQTLEWGMQRQILLINSLLFRLCWFFFSHLVQLTATWSAGLN